MEREWSPVEPDDALRRALGDACGSEVRATWGGRQALGLLQEASHGLVVQVREAKGETGSATEATLDLEHGRVAWRLHARVLGYDNEAWTLSWPTRAERRDRRRFDRVRNPDGSVRLTWLREGGDVPVELVDVSVNGAAFVVPADHGVTPGDRLSMELVDAGAPPSAMTFEVVGVHGQEGRTLARGRFLPPGGASPGEVEVSIEDLARLLG